MGQGGKDYRVTREEFSYVLGMLRGAFPNQTVTVETAETYFLLLKDLPFEVAKSATTRVLAEAIFWPAPGVIRMKAAEVLANEPDAPTVMAEIWSAVQRLGFERGPGPISDAASYVIRCIGWQTLCDTTPDAKMGMNAHMLKVAALYRTRSLEHENLASLPQAAPSLPELEGRRKQIEGLADDVGKKWFTQ